MEETKQTFWPTEMMGQERREGREWSVALHIQSAYLFCTMSDTVLGLGNSEQTEAQLFWVYMYRGPLLKLWCVLWLGGET